MKKTKLIVKTKDKKYNILIGKNLLKNTGLFINKEFKNIKKIGIITDSNVPKVLIKNTQTIFFVKKPLLMILVFYGCVDFTTKRKAKHELLKKTYVDYCTLNK